MILLLAAPLWAQIYADFTVSQGGSPLGTFRARLDHDKAPRTCASFIGLATGSRQWLDLTTGAFRSGVPFYDGLTFHRLDHDFVIQGGSRNGLGTDGPGYTIQDEFHAGLRHSGRYILSMANTGDPGTGGSQFFITLGAAGHLDDKHSVFGEVISGKSIIDAFADDVQFPTDLGDRPLTPIVMESVVISGPDLAGFNIHDPVLRLPMAQSMPPTSIFKDSNANTVTLTFDQEAGREYQIFYSSNLTGWTRWIKRTSGSNATAADFILPATITADQFFVRMPAFDYSLLPAVTDAVVANGRILTLSDRLGNWIEMTFDGAGAGTWTDSIGNSGALTSVTLYDYIQSGLYDIPPNWIAIGGLVVNFDAPAGPLGWSSLATYLNFHEPLNGFSYYGNKSVSALPIFTLSPP